MGNGIISLFGLLQFALLYKAFSKEDVGIWFFFMATQSIFDSIRNGFLGTATIKFYAGAEQKRAANVLGSVWYLAIGITMLMLVVNGSAYLALPFISNAPLIISIKWVGITILSSLPFSVIFWKLQADEHYGTILWLRFINNGSTIIAFLILLFLGKFSLQTALLWNFITNCLTSAVGIIANKGGLKTITQRSKDTITELVNFGKYSLATNLSSNLLRAVDTYIVTFMLGPGALAILSVPSKLIELVEIPLRSFVSTGMSSMATAFNQKNMHQVTYILKKYAGMLTIVFIPLAIGMFFFADIPVNLLSSGKYRGTEAANLYRFIMFNAILYPIDRFNGVTLDIIHQPKINFYKVQVMLVVNIIADFVCIGSLHNVYGVPLAGLITLSTGIAFGYINLNKYLEVRIPDIITTGFYEIKLLVSQLFNRKKVRG